MYKVMLIDDDVPVLKYLERLIPWERLQLDICASTYSSVKALEMFKHFRPDIVITDIGIPQIDGIELARMFREENPGIRIIFLTCHEDFHYARRALQLNADEYLIKDELTAEKLEAALQESIRKLAIHSRYLDPSSIRNTLHRNKILLIQSFTEQLGKMEQDDLREQAGQIGIKWKYDCFMLSVTTIQYATFAREYRFKDAPILKYGLFNIAEELCSQVGGFTPLLDKDSNLIIVYNFYNHLDRNPHQTFHRFLHTLSDKVKQFLNIELIHCFTKALFPVPSLGSILLAAKGQRNDLFYKLDEPFHALDSKKETWNPPDMGPLRTLEEEWRRIIEQRDVGELRSFMTHLRVHTEKLQMDPDKLKAVLLRWLQLALDTPDQYNKDFEACFMQTYHISQTLSLMEHVSTAAFAHPYASPKTDYGEPNPKIHEIRHYIMNHLSENITSLTMANYLHLNPSYFSRYFKRMTGETFTDYVHTIKMSVAVKMLAETDRTVELISYSLGYSDRTYFSKIFSKYIGASPTEYKQTKFSYL